MRKLLSLAVALSICSFGFVGCKKTETGAKKVETVKTDGGEKTTTTETKTETKGDNPPK